MDEQQNNSGAQSAAIERLAAAAEALDAALARLAAGADQQSELGTKIDRIVAAVDENAVARQRLEARIAELERTNAELKANAAEMTLRAGRKTLSPAMTALLSKSGVETASLDGSTVEKALAGLSVEQRIAVKAEMARAGLIG